MRTAAGSAAARRSRPPVLRSAADHAPGGRTLPYRPLPAIVARLRAAGCVFAEDEAELLAAAASNPAELDAMVTRRAAGLPLEQVLGWAEFCGQRIAVESGVFVPRRRTEFLARQAAALARQAAALARQAGAAADVRQCTRQAGAAADARQCTRQAGAAADARQRTRQAGTATDARQRTRQAGAVAERAVVVVDLCCGSGALGAALAAVAGRVELHATDIDPAAVRCARRNLAAVGGHVYQGDLYDPLPAALRGRVDVVVVNAPYVPTGEVGLLPAEARVHEPRAALDGGPDGLIILRRVIAGAPSWLAPGGHLLCEASPRQAARLAAAVTGAGLAPRVASSGDLDTAVLVAGRPSSRPSG